MWGALGHAEAEQWTAGGILRFCLTFCDPGAFLFAEAVGVACHVYTMCGNRLESSRYARGVEACLLR